MGGKGIDKGAPVRKYICPFGTYKYEPLEWENYGGMRGLDGKVDPKWREALVKKMGVANKRSVMVLNPGGFWMVGLGSKDKPCWPPIDANGNSYIIIFAHHMEFGFHFPFHQFLHVLYEYNIILHQLTPYSFR